MTFHVCTVQPHTNLEQNALTPFSCRSCITPAGKCGIRTTTNMHFCSVKTAANNSGQTPRCMCATTTLHDEPETWTINPAFLHETAPRYRIAYMLIPSVNRSRLPTTAFGATGLPRAVPSAAQICQSQVVVQVHALPSARD